MAGAVFMQFFLMDKIRLDGSGLVGLPQAASLMGPLLGCFIPLAIGSFDLHYPERLGRWFRTSKATRRRYLKQLIKEAADRERSHEYERDSAADHRRWLEEELGKLESPVGYRVTAEVNDEAHAQTRAVPP
jgi:hypothetical protein